MTTHDFLGAQPKIYSHMRPQWSLSLSPDPNYSPKYDLRINLCCKSIRENIPTTTCCIMKYRGLVRAFRLKTCRNTSSFQQQDSVDCEAVSVLHSVCELATNPAFAQASEQFDPGISTLIDPRPLYYTGGSGG